MDKRELMLISIATMVLIAFVVAAPAEMLGDDEGYKKIDATLSKRMISKDEEKIPIIAILDSKESPDLCDFDIKYSYRLFHGFAGEASPSAIRKLAQSNSVQGIYLDGLAHLESPDESSFGNYYISPAQYINASKLWKIGIDGKGVTVAVIDSGIDKNHPDLDNKVIGEKNFVNDEATADDLLGHGTMVAGIIAGSGAASNGTYRGIAPGASLLNVKVIDSEGNGQVSDIIAGIEWALYNGADILSLSLGGVNLGETNPPITMAADKAMDEGAVVFVAAGNRNSAKTGGQLEKSPSISSPLIKIAQLDNSKVVIVPIILALPPGLIDSPGDGIKVITLGSSDPNGHVADFSGSGPTRDDRTKPDIVAPGVDVISTVPPGLEKPEYIDIYYARESGTSLSTPVAAGMAALLLQEKANLTPAGIKAAMTKGAWKLNNTLGEEYEEYYQGTGLLEASKSYKLLGEDICGVVPDKWIAGRWAYLPAGKGLYVGLETGADRPQKKLYALAPGDEDWTNRFVFFTNLEKKNLKTTVSGPISNWINLQTLPATISSNAQEVFGASITVPEGTKPGIYNGSIDINEKDNRILTIPVSVEVAKPFDITGGGGVTEGSLKGCKWDYYYLDVVPGTSELSAGLNWTQNSNLDLFLLAPTSEYYAGVQRSQMETRDIHNPPSGRWLIAVHNQNSSDQVDYSLQVERSLIETFPKRWMINSAQSGTSVKSKFAIINKGRALENLSYNGFIENITTQELKGSVGYKEVWEKAINVTNRTTRLFARLSGEDGTNQSELLLVFENPDGQPADAALNSGDIGPLEISKPEVGLWKVKVYGYNVPETGQHFNLKLLESKEELWNWLTIKGSTRIGSESNGTIEANMTIPRNASILRLEGFIEAASASQSFQIPVSLAIAGASLTGLKRVDVMDSNMDGYFDNLSLAFGVNVSMPGIYQLEGALTDCDDNIIERITEKADLQESDSININVNGSDLWKKGKCGPFKISRLILHDQYGNLIDVFENNIIIQKNPKQFQPPAAYFADGIINQTAPNKISMGVNLSVIKSGRYRVSARIVDNEGRELGQDTVASNLKHGNATVMLEFNPTKFTMLGKKSQVHLVDLVLSKDESELDRRDDAWSSGEMSPLGFKSSILIQGNNGDDNNSLRSLQWRDGKMVIY